MHGGICHEDIESFKCKCEDGYKGLRCESKIFGECSLQTSDRIARPFVQLWDHEKYSLKTLKIIG